MRLTWAFHVDSVTFTPDVVAGTASLGGSESACLGLARALARRGHRVSIFTTKLHKDVPAVDADGVRWYHTREIPEVSHFVDWDVFVALRMPHVYTLGIQAAVRVLWNQDLMTGEDAKQQTMALGWAYDLVAYVSHYHRKQWEGVIPELKPFGWVTKNGYDPALVPTKAVKVPNRIIHISRPERGLRPLLAMWPELRRRVPEAELHLCRYNSMYDAQGWGRVCAAYDAEVARVNAEVGGITYLGELGKPALYQAIAEAAVMWYPGVADFAETSCIAAIEAQACGTPFVGSWKGALPETVPSGYLVQGDADSPDYQAQSIGEVVRILTDGGAKPGITQHMVQVGLEHARAYTYDAIAAEWEAKMLDYLSARVDAEGPKIVQQLLHEDDHVAAQVLARELGDTATADWCQYVIDGKDQGSEDYSARALDPRIELHSSPRIASVVDLLKDRTAILDLACGNGTFALAFAQANPAVHVLGVDYSQGNIDVARQVAAEMGLADRLTFLCAPVYDFTTHQPTADLAALKDYGPFDGVFIGEFLEHIANVSGFLSSVHAVAQAGARIVCTMPSGPFGELAARDIPLKRGHVHHYRPDDLEALFGAQAALDVAYLPGGMSTRGSNVGHWILAYETNGQPIGERPIAKRLLTTRPKRALSVGVLAGDTTDLRRCLESVWRVCDEIVLGDTGAERSDLELVAASFPRTRIVPVGDVKTLPGGFSEARNRVLEACTGDWFLWIDTDERLMHGEALGKYLQGGVFTGYGLKQNHLMLDTPNTFDTPIRVFRRQPDIQFYGCIHEQPQQGDCNGDILPSLQLYDVDIAHTGYLNEDIRRDKALRRNLPLLIQDAKMFPDRRLGKVLILRDALNLGVWAMEAAGGKLTSEAKAYFQQVIAIFEAHLADPADKYHGIARPFYEQALRRVAGAFEVEVAFAAGQHGLKGRAAPERVWVRSPDQIAPLLAHKVQTWTKPFQPAPPLDVEPLPVDDTVYVEGVAV